MEIFVHFTQGPISSIPGAAVLQIHRLPSQSGKELYEHAILLGRDPEQAPRNTIAIDPGTWRFTVLRPGRPAAFGDFEFKTAHHQSEVFIQVDAFELRRITPDIRKRNTSSWSLSASRGGSTSHNENQPIDIANDDDFSLKPWWIRTLGPDENIFLRNRVAKATGPGLRVSLWSVPWVSKDELQVKTRGPLKQGLKAWLSLLDGEQAITKENDIVSRSVTNGLTVYRREFAFHLPSVKTKQYESWARSFLTLTFADEDYLMVLPADLSSSRARGVPKSMSLDMSFRQKTSASTFLAAKASLGDPIVTAMAEFLTSGDLPSALSLFRSSANANHHDSIGETVLALVTVQALVANLIDSEKVVKQINSFAKSYPMLPEAWICKAWVALYQGKGEGKSANEALNFLYISIISGLPSFSVATKMLVTLYQQLSPAKDEVTKSVDQAINWLAMRAQSNSLFTLVRVKNGD